MSAFTPDAVRDFPHNTCAASRHVQMMGEALRDDRMHHMLVDDPEHCAESMLSVVESLYKARAELAALKAATQTHPR